MKYLRSNSYNVDVAKVFGVTCAVFLDFLDNEVNRAKEMDEYVGHINLDRKSIYIATALIPSEQESAEELLKSRGVLTVSKARNSEKFSYEIDDKKLCDILSSGAVVFGEVNKFYAKKTSDKPKRNYYASNIKKNIIYGDEEVDKLLYDWVMALKEAGKGMLSMDGFKMQQEELKKVCGDNKAMAIEVIKIAVKNNYRQLEWAVNKYNNAVKSSGYNFSDYNSIKMSDSSTVDTEAF